MSSKLWRSFGLAVLLVLPACGGGVGGDVPPPPSDQWTWFSGSMTTDAPGVYGVQGVRNPANVPGARQIPMGWTGQDGTFWLFGGLHNAGTPPGLLNDLWHWNGEMWTWVSGSNTPDQHGVYGTKGVAAAANVPGSRSSAATWVDASGKLWLFGGEGFSATNGPQALNDLWRWDGAKWTWMAGTDQIAQVGVYGTQGAASAANTPGGRDAPATWTTNGGSDFWLFGGLGYGISASSNGMLSDLWRWNGSAWTWVWGPQTLNDAPVYGTLGVPAASNTPGGRENPVTWADEAGNLWLFGGLRIVPPGLAVSMNDLWRWDGTNWTWMSGSNGTNSGGTYGTRTVADAANVPGARTHVLGWVQPGTGDFWLYGGTGYNAVGSFAVLDDLWRWDGAAWTWMSGSMLGGQSAVFGTPGVSDAANRPGAHGSGAGFLGKAGSLWIWGGFGKGTGSLGDMNDLWRYVP